MLAFTCVRGVGLCVRPLSTHACDNAKAVVFELSVFRGQVNRKERELVATSARENI